MFAHNIDPVLLQLGPFEIRYYGLFYVAAFIIGYYLLAYLAKKKQIPLNKDDVADLLLYMLIGVVVGARLFYVAVYNLPFYLGNPFQVIAVWNGGLSFHGGLLGAAIALILFCKKRKIHPYEIADILVIPVALGLALGRLGNFVNAELVGRVTDVKWAVLFPGETEYRHPSQIYASIKNLVIFGILWNLKDKTFPKGFMLWLFVLLYSSFRFTVEFFREPDTQLGFLIAGLSMGQLLSIVLFVIGAFFMWKVTKNK